MNKSDLTDWPFYMVTAAVKFSSASEHVITTYTSTDTARMDILNLLNWYEAHDEYHWPDFLGLGYDFYQAMRLRRVLVNDVFNGLQSAGKIKVADELDVPGTPQGGVTCRKRSNTHDGGLTTDRKRLCRRAEGPNTNAVSEDYTMYGEQEMILATNMQPLIRLFKNAVQKWVSEFDGENDHSEKALAERTHSPMVEMQSTPNQPCSNQELEARTEAINRDTSTTLSPEL